MICNYVLDLPRGLGHFSFLAPTHRMNDPLTRPDFKTLARPAETCQIPSRSAILWRRCPSEPWTTLKYIPYIFISHLVCPSIVCIYDFKYTPSSEPSSDICLRCFVTCTPCIYLLDFQITITCSVRHATMPE